MTARLSRGAQAAVAYVESLTAERLREVLPVTSPAEEKARMSRQGEDDSTVASDAQIRAIYTSEWFWELAAMFPNNRLWWGGKTTDTDRRRGGRPQHYPDYLMLLILCIAGLATVKTVRAARDRIKDPRRWADLVEHVDQYVPEGWTRLGDLAERTYNRRPRRPITQPVGAPPPRTRALRRRRDNKVTVLRRPALPEPPTLATVRYWQLRWRGLNVNREPVLPGHDYYGIRERVLEKFEALAVEQAQYMGMFDKSQNFVFGKPDRKQHLGFDGVVFSPRRRRNGNNPTVGIYKTGEGKTVSGTKYGITSVRRDGMHHTRVIISFHHIHKDLPESYDNEQAVVRDVVPRIHKHADGGMKGLLVDSAIRGEDVTALQKQGITVVNYPYAESNPDGGPGNRLDASRVEKSHLRTVVTHTNDYGATCEHYIFAMGGELVQVLMNGTGEYEIQPLEYLRYLQRPNRDGTRREYHEVRITCAHGDDLKQAIPLFHTEGTSGDPAFNAGEYVRVYPPRSENFLYLYGARNDTESRHADLKSRLTHLPRHVAGQELRLLGAAVALNALSWQVLLQSYGADNVIDDTA